MKIAVIGAGAIGGLIAARLTAAGLPVPLVSRRRTLDALRRDGLSVEGPAGQPVTVRPEVTDDTLALGPQDAVVLAVPAPTLPEVLELLPPLLGRETRLVVVVGGVPWWFPAGNGQDARPLASVDPHGLLWNAIPAERIVGAVPRMAVQRRSATYLRHLGGLRLALGPAVNGGEVGDLVTLFGAGGFNAVAADDVRAEVWDALLPPLAFGALGITSGLSAPEIVGRTDLHPTLEALVRELAELAAALGHPMTVGLDELWTLAQQPGRIRPDLTADLDARRRAELEAVLDAPLELAARANVPMPTLNTLRALIRTRTQR